jgi:hypothetical protein
VPSWRKVLSSRPQYNEQRRQYRFTIETTAPIVAGTGEFPNRP